MFCTKCGNEIPDNTKFCPYCGQENKAAGQNSVPPSGGDRKKSPLPLIIGLVLLFLIVFIGSFFIFFFLQGKDETAVTTEESVTRISRETEAETAPAKEEEVETEAAEPEEEDEEFVIPPLSAEDDGNLFGNSHCYARIVSDGTYLYFRNALDKEGTYWVKKGDTNAQPLSDIYMKDLHYKDGWIYYSRTTEGDIAQGTRDNNIYRMTTNGSDNTNLSNLVFDNPQSWLSFETMTGGRCFFVYTDGKGVSVDIGYAPEEGGSSVFLAKIPAANVVDNPCINVIENSVYFLAKDGLHCVDINTSEDTLAIPSFSCKEYMIYGGTIYFWENAADGHAVLYAMSLDGSDRQELFSSSDTGFSGESMQVNIYNGEIYFLLSASYPDGSASGSLYRIHLDGTSSEKLMDNISWFNIVDDTLYYRYIGTGAVSTDQDTSSYYYYSPFESVNQGTGAANATELFDPLSSGSSQSVGAQSSTSSSQLPDNVRAAYETAMQYPQFESGYGGNPFLCWKLCDSYDKQGYIDHGSCYEIQGAISIPIIVPADIVSQFEPGFTFSAGDRTFTIKNVSSDSGGATGTNSEYFYILSDGTAWAFEASDDLVTQIIYEGSIFFDKNCRIYCGQGMDSHIPPISFLEYQEIDPFSYTWSDEQPFQYGSGSFFGDIIFDHNTGLIIDYVEIYGD